jgi:hypothetical protein
VRGDRLIQITQQYKEGKFMQIFQMNDEILVSHNGETSKINWHGAFIPSSWQAQVSKGAETLVNAITWTDGPVSLSKTQTTQGGKRLFVNAMLSLGVPAVVVALDFVPEDYPFQVEYRGSEYD